MIDGTCDAGFKPVRDAFAENFAARGETGAALCVTAGRRVVADLWGGWTSAAGLTPWRPDTLVNFFSVGKGLMSVLTARLAGAGLLDTDAPVARYWPEFGTAGKESVTVRQLLSHQAGVPAVRRRLPPGAMLDWTVMTRAIAEQAPWWQPGTAHGYHVNTFGFALGEVLRRVTGRTVGALLREDIAGPLGADVYIGLPAAQHGRVADFEWPGMLRLKQTGPSWPTRGSWSTTPTSTRVACPGPGLSTRRAGGRRKCPPPTGTAAPGEWRAYMQRWPRAGLSTASGSWTPRHWPTPRPSRSTGRIASCTGRPGSASASS